MSENLKPIAAIRLQIKRCGYDLIPVREDKKGITGWPKMPNEEAKVRRWGLPATGIRMFGNDVFVLDLDILIEAVCDEILAEYTEQWPEFMRDCLRRHSGAVKIALIGRCNTAKRSRQTRFYYAGATDTTGNRVEIFGRNDKRLVVVQGRHSEGREYGYIGRPIWETPLDELPWFPDAGIYKALDIAEVVMAKHGLQQRHAAVQPSAAKDAYDITPEQIWTLSDGETIALGELETSLEGYRFASSRGGGNGEVRGYASLWDPASIPGVTDPGRVKALRGGTGLILHDFKTGISHRWKHCEPKPDTLKETLKELMKGMMAKTTAKAVQS